MAVKYDFYETPAPDGRKEKKSLHVRILPGKTVDSETLAQTIHQRSTFNVGEVKAVITALRDLMIETMQEGNRIHLDGIGYFQMTATCQPVESEKEIRAESVQCKSIAFRPEKDFKRALSARAHFVRAAIKKHSNNTSSADIDKLLTDYFASNNHITRTEFERLTHLTKMTACRRLKLLVDEGRLQKEGVYRSPIYTAVPGHYGK